MNQHARIEQRPIPFIDVAAQRRRLGRAIDEATSRVLDHCQFLMVPEVLAFEKDLVTAMQRHGEADTSRAPALVLLPFGNLVSRD